MNHAAWVARKIRGRLQRGWEAWESPVGTMWARVKGDKVESEPMPRDEQQHLDAVLREEAT